MANLTLSDTSYTVVGRTITVNYTTDVLLTNIKLSKDNINFIEPISFSQSCALFDITTWNNGEYTNCILRGYYEDNRIMVDEELVVLNEDSNTTFSVYLNKAPDKDTVISLECDDKVNATIDKTSLTFNSDNYNVPQTVTVTGIYNTDDVDKIVNIILSNPALSSKAVTATVKNIDNYYGEIVLSTTSLSVNENNSTTFTVKLNKRPTNNQIVTLSRNNNNVSLSANSLTFTRSNYNNPQTVTVTGAYDESLNNKTCNITLSSPNVKNATVGATVTNIDVYGEIIVDNTSLSFNEGTSKEFTVKLSKAPRKNQIVTLSKNNNNVTLNKTSLTFTPSNYNTPQTVKLTSVHDETHYRDKTSNILLTSPYVSNKTINATIKNIDISPEVFGDIVASTNTLSVNENNSVTFTVKLNQAPTNNQIVNLSKNNNNISLDKTSLTFTPSNYNTPQTVTASGVHDSSSFDNKTSVLTLSSKNVNNSTINVTVVNIDKHTIVNNLTNCTNSNNITEITHNEAYSATISANDNCQMKSITVTMGGVDITSTCVDQYNITIPNVTGDIIITANAQVLVIEACTEYQGYISTNTGELGYNNYYTSTDYVDISGFRNIGVNIRLNLSSTWYKITSYALYNENKVFISSGEPSKYLAVVQHTLTSSDLHEAAYIRITIECREYETIEPNSNHIITFSPLS